MDITNGQEQFELDYSVNIISNKSYKEDKIKSAFFTIKGKNPETDKIDTFDAGRWFSNVSDSIEKGDTLYKIKGEKFFLIKKEKYILKVNSKVNTNGEIIEIIKRF
ncbi:hypothetical protein SAMN05443634_111129 [Chishuiella changwenlii]|uniref:Uncharacterized protein n=2 Tax=Chishuiella changwenlii TaxID=1434701 RepID=A0A1M7BSP2_9FLAO|nr:hypothetical protein [Chishuiella changwenlii]GGF09685.1 hypothetical protein GCM10010984_28550 [Chishuiella changwenlii]SHL58011.1 hypothetical protein SAMN05443634_111129 [Chishuiella changwenlii]